MSAARDALTSYGYTLEPISGNLVRPGRKTQQWRETTGGWLRFEADGSRTPYRVDPEAEVQAGLDFNNASHAEYFEWVWPDEEVARCYQAAVAEQGTQSPQELSQPAAVQSSLPAPVNKKRGWFNS